MKTAIDLDRLAALALDGDCKGVEPTLINCKLDPTISQHPHEVAMLTTQTKTAINTAIAATKPRLKAGEFLAHSIITNPDDYPADMLEAARVILAPVKLQGVGA